MIRLKEMETFSWSTGGPLISAARAVLYHHRTWHFPISGPWWPSSRVSETALKIYTKYTTFYHHLCNFTSLTRSGGKLPFALCIQQIAPLRGWKEDRSLTRSLNGFQFSFQTYSFTWFGATQNYCKFSVFEINTHPKIISFLFKCSDFALKKFCHFH